MRLYFESINLEKWNFFNEIKSIGDVNNFFYVNGMEIGDKVILHIGKNKDRINGIYAFGTIISNPRLETNPENYCFGKKAVDVRIDRFSNDKPLLEFEQYKDYIKNFRIANKVSEESTEKIMDLLGF